MATLGVDFGTSNTAAAVLAGDTPFLIEVEPGETTLPTSVFFDPSAKVTLYGHAANRALIDGREGRFMRALKSVLGTPLMREERRIAHERLTLVAVVARFLERVRSRAEAVTGMSFDHALSGRPVRFHSTDDARNAQAEVDLRDAYLQAGFASVDFMYEPEAAALTARTVTDGSLGLVIDIGGGTSDFSIFERAEGRTRIIASHGIRMGGTDFDRHLSLTHVMPLLGRGAEVRNEMGQGTHTAPVALFNDLATWQKIPFLYTPDTLRLAERYARLGVEPLPFQRLVQVLDLELGHDLAFAVEAGKIAANATDAAIRLGVVEKGLTIPLTKASLITDLSTQIAEISVAAQTTLNQASLAPDRIGTLVFVGGSSLLSPVIQAMSALFPQAAQERANAFTAVADGLAIAAA